MLHLQGNRLIASEDAYDFIRRNKVVPILARNVRKDNDEPWFIMPLATESAAEYLSRTQGMSAIWLFKEACLGVEYIHTKGSGVWHRDVKPQNILLFELDGQTFAAVSDLGLGRFARRDTVTLTQPGMSYGTVGYMSPEQQAGGEVDQRTDIYSLGKLLYQILTGQAPTTIVLANVPSEYARIIETATEYDPKNRYSSVREILDALPS